MTSKLVDKQKLALKDTEWRGVNHLLRHFDDLPRPANMAEVALMCKMGPVHNGIVPPRQDFQMYLKRRRKSSRNCSAANYANTRSVILRKKERKHVLRMQGLMKRLIENAPGFQIQGTEDKMIEDKHLGDAGDTGEIESGQSKNLYDFEDDTVGLEERN
jgi:hypothetical protein